MKPSLSLALLFAAASVVQAQGTVEVARIVVSPSKPVVNAGDTLRLTAQALDASGRSIPGVRVRFQAQGARFEGDVDSLGLVTAGATGTLPVAVVALAPGARPKVERIEVRMVPGPAASITPSSASVRMAIGQRLRLGGEVFSRTGDPRPDERVSWRSSAPSIVRVDQDGMLTSVSAGRANVTGTAGAARVTVPVDVVNGQVSTLELFPARVDARQGDVIRLKATARDARGRELAGLATGWSFSPGGGVIGQDGAFTGYEPGEYVITASQGTRTAQAVIRLTERDVRRPLSVVGRLPRTRFSTEEVWIHPNGKFAYLGSGGGGDVMYAIDISDPSKPTVTDSIVANTRRVNDVMTTPDGRYLVFTREGASDRKNGIVICSLEDPAHPKVISEFTDGVTSGVHSAFIHQQPKYGTHVYLTNDGTGALHVLDISDPYKPKEVAQWKTPKAHGDVGRTLHDIDVQDGLLYGSWWNDGLVILDVGNGIKGGSPSNPVLVSQFKYDLNALYRDVEASGGPGFIRGTHTAWRHKNYVFIADEVFPAGGVKGAKDAAAGRAYGRLQVIDVSDMANPRSVAHYEPEFGGVHNVWVAGDTLYMGAYNGGFRAFDVSGELRGDLRAQGREIGHLNTADMDGRVKNTAMTWGVVVKDGLAYVNDMYNGLWIVKIEPKPAVVP
ncbi:MAG: Ig-like domain-containing protein [Gemmatimonadaceae bacterium]|nr:Ig-like domain-containing protein [Gemmatimonadaceae bacterium]